MSRPSGVLATDQVLTGTQMTELRAKFDEVSKGMNQGNVPILGNGMKWYPMSITAHDAQILELYNASTLDICRVFGVPIQLLGQETNGAASSVQTLIGQFKAGSLLYMAELIEFGLEELFKFDHIKDTVRFDLDNISRADFETEINTLSKGAQNGIFASNEARNRVGLDSVPFGDQPRVQAQNVRLEDAVPAPSAPSAGQPAAPPKPEPPEDDDDDVETSEEVSKRLAVLIKGYSSHA
jgi:HK97 family phage portal protein